VTTSGLKVTVTGVTLTAGVPTVTFSFADDQGKPVDRLGVYSVNAPLSIRLAVAKVTKDAQGNVLPYTTLTGTAGNPTTVTAVPTEVGTAAGTYTYTFPSTVVIDAASTDTHVLWMQVARQTDLVNTVNPSTFTAINQEYSWIPSGAGTVLKREIVADAACARCHAGFKPESATNVGGFHGYGRIDPNFCDMCHNPGRTNKAADAEVFIHRIHNGDHLQNNATTNNIFHGIVATFPQDARNCATCHGGALQGGQAQARPNRQACGSCHDYVKWDNSAAIKCVHPLTPDAVTGQYAVCNHAGDTVVTTDRPDSSCSGCHSAADITGYHVPGWQVATGATSSLSGVFVPLKSALPPTAANLTAAIANVLVDATTLNPSVNFKLVKDGVDLVFPTYAAGVAGSNELIPNFIGTTSIYFAYGVPQDGITAPADFNASVSVDLYKAWAGTAQSGTPAPTVTLTGPAAGGYYTLTVTNVAVPATDTLLSAFVGLGAMKQVNVPGYLYDTATGKGGVAAVITNASKAAVGKVGRRAIVDNARCLDCHDQLGVTPYFHGGGRNDGTLCAVCHNGNRTSGGWSANAKDFIHSLHAGRVRSQPFTWQIAAGYTFWDVEFPNRLNNCLSCHKAGTYDLSAVATQAAVDNMLWSTTATGNLLATTSSVYAVGTIYGTGFSYNAVSGVTTAAQGNTLVTSPITAACIACHDSNAAYSHMDLMGGSFYQLRSSMPTGPLAVGESCLVCHGPGNIADIKAVHGQ
jgi:OmcA/MtrC family decaheme c-type cytochrome